MWEFRRTAWSFSSGGNNSALYKSTDAGTTWNKIHNGFPDGQLGRLAIAVAPSDASILYTVIEAEDPKRKGLYRSDDAGANWKQLNNDFGITVRPILFFKNYCRSTKPGCCCKRRFIRLNFERWWLKHSNL